jgi:phage-related protein
LLEYLTLVFDGKKSSDFDLSCANGTGGNSLYQERFVANKTINETTIPGRSRPYFLSVTREPIEIDLILAPTDDTQFTEEQIKLIQQWIDKDTYTEFYFEEYPLYRYFGIMYSDSSFSHNGLGNGYFTIKIRCDSPFPYSYEITNQGLIEVPSDGLYYTLENKGNQILQPYIQIEKIGDGLISIMNLTNGGQQCVIDNLKDGEVITIDNQNEDISSDLDNVYHFDDHNGVWVNLPIGRNRLFFNGQCKVKLSYRYIYS